MSLIRRTSPFGELLSLRQAMDHLFEESFVRPRSLYGNGNGNGNGTGDSLALPLDVSITAESLVVKAALPGVKPEDVDITVTGDTLTISGSNEERSETREQEYLFQEVRRGSFSRTLTLPANLQAEKASASFENGMLTLTIPKAEEAKPRQIRISANSDAANARSVGPESSAEQASNGTEQSQQSRG